MDITLVEAAISLDYKNKVLLLDMREKIYPFPSCLGKNTKSLNIKNVYKLVKSVEN